MGLNSVARFLTRWCVAGSHQVGAEAFRVQRGTQIFAFLIVKVFISINIICLFVSNNI